MAHALFDHRQNIDARKVGQQVFEFDQAVREAARAAGFREFLESDCLFEREFPHRRARNFREVRATAQLLPHFMRQGTDIGAGGAFDDKVRDASRDSCQLVLEDLHLNGF